MHHQIPATVSIRTYFQFTGVVQAEYDSWARSTQVHLPSDGIFLVFISPLPESEQTGNQVTFSLVPAPLLEILNAKRIPYSLR